MIPDYGENVYEILSELIGLKFKAQVKNSGIEFKKIYQIMDLETNEKYYSLIVNHIQIDFKDKTEFLKKFIILLEKNINEFDQRFEELQRISNDKWIDKNYLFGEHEEIGNNGFKQSKLLEKMKNNIK